MTRILGAIAIVAFLSCAAFIALAVHMTGGEFSFSDDFVGQTPLTQSADSKEWAWSGGDKIELDVPTVLHLEPGDAGRVIVHGNTDMISRVKFAHGKLAATREMFGHNDTVDTVLRGVVVRTVTVNGSGKLELGHIDQDALAIHINGSGAAAAEGRADAVELHISGSGTAHLGKLAAKVVRIHISGSGNAEIAPSEAVDVHIAGSGKVTLLTKPKSITTHIAGSGRIVEAP